MSLIRTVALLAPLLACAGQRGDAVRELSRHVVPVAVVAWPPERRPTCSVVDMPPPPEMPVYASPDGYTTGGLDRYYVTKRAVEDVLGWYRYLMVWSEGVNACLRRLSHE